jgi:hypothetical protein
MSEEGLSGDRLRWTTPALLRVCSALAGGLGRLLLDLARHKAQDLRGPSSIFNTVLADRFDKLSGCQLLVDTRHRTIEGLVARSARYVDNLTIFEATRDYLNRSRAGVSNMSECCKIGRSLSVRFASQEVLFRLGAVGTNREDPFAAGFVFRISESDAICFQAASAVVRLWSGSRAVSPYRKEHRVYRFRMDRLRRQLARVWGCVHAARPDAGRLRKSLQEMRKQPIGFSSDRKEHARRVDALSRWLAAYGIRKPVTEAVLLHVLSYGSYRSERMESSGTGCTEFHTGRNLYDLFNALTYVAKRSHVGDREALESLAYSMMVGTANFMRRI